MTRVSSRKRITQPAKRAPTRLSQLDRAYRTLGVEPQVVNTTPKITHILSKLHGGGIKKAIEFLRGSDSEEARKWLSLYDDIPASVRKLLPFEAYCVAINITTKRMLEVITGACFDQSSATSNLLSAAAHPDVVSATVKSARHLDGHADRKMLHLHHGFVPVPKSSATFIAKGGVQNNLQINDNSSQVTFAVAEIGNIERRQGRIADRFNEEQLGMGSTRQPPGLPPAVEETILDLTEPEPETEEYVESTLVDWGT